MAVARFSSWKREWLYVDGMDLARRTLSFRPSPPVSSVSSETNDPVAALRQVARKELPLYAR
jgi:hypothetical protein